MKRLTLLILIAIWPLTARAGESAPAKAELRRQCDELIARAVKRPYGWGWTEDAPEQRPKGGGQPVSMEPGGTAAAGFVLYWAGDLLDEPRYKDAAVQAARGIVASQRSTGAVIARPMFLPNVAGAKEPAALVADRTPTCAAMGLLLTILEDAGAPDPAIKGSALRGLNWLLHQQPANGAWMQADPPSTQPSDAVRLIRLDNGDWRNCTFTLLLAAEVLNDSRCSRAVEKSNARLMRLRIGDQSRIGRPLWATAYGAGIDATPSDRLGDYPPGVDPLATRFAMETLLATVLALGDPPKQLVEEQPPVPSAALADAAAAVEKLPKYGGKWMRNYDFDVTATVPPPPEQRVEGSLLAAPPQAKQATGLWGLNPVLRAVDVLNKEGRTGLGKRLALELSLHQRLCAAVCGLEEQPFRLSDQEIEWAVRVDENKTAVRVVRLWKLVRQMRKG